MEALSEIFQLIKIDQKPIVEKSTKDVDMEINLEKQYIKETR